MCIGNIGRIVGRLTTELRLWTTYLLMISLCTHKWICNEIKYDDAVVNVSFAHIQRINCWTNWLIRRLGECGAEAEWFIRWAYCCIEYRTKSNNTQRAREISVRVRTSSPHWNHFATELQKIIKKNCRGWETNEMRWDEWTGRNGMKLWK